jgi:hypothetical protein
MRMANKKGHDAIDTQNDAIGKKNDIIEPLAKLKKLAIDNFGGG